ncbi:helix-turn-helix transcriptional regulator [Streptomyces sp.]|uniref:helix-turn-helix transcriptional regulator n=1 Tax=Streptomyces sp. TaxID=1931 RepID=UPI002D7A32CD|nr:helix-turn-helix transcriptional regulator [Streptomyces sp.]HET6356863.1 helix-turn-helix transcriptional regulator [Streptomyces sp.]
MLRPAAVSGTTRRTILHLWEVEDATDTVYREMLRRPGVGLDGLKASLPLDEAEIRQALHRLSDLALIHNSWEETEVVHPVSPQLGFQALLARKQSEIVRQQQALEEAREKMGSLVDHYMSEYAAARGMGVEHIRGPATMRMRLRELMAVTERELLSFAPGGPSAQEDRPVVEPRTEAMLDDSVEVRTVCPEHVRHDPEGVGQSPGVGATTAAAIRTVPGLSCRLYIADRRTALVQLNIEDASQDALVIEEPAVVAILCSFFETVWSSATPLSAAACGEDALTAQEVELLRLLGQGLTDEAAARKLGVSLRTERRMLTKLSQCLDAQSRFQLGRRAAEHGLL